MTVMWVHLSVLKIICVFHDECSIASELDNPSYKESWSDL